MAAANASLGDLRTWTHHVYCAFVGLNNKLITSVYVDTRWMLTILSSFTSRHMACMDSWDHSVCQVNKHTSRGKAVIKMARQAFGECTPVHVYSRRTFVWTVIQLAPCTMNNWHSRQIHQAWERGFARTLKMNLCSFHYFPHGFR